jgi:hypothetical protein
VQSAARAVSAPARICGRCGEFLPHACAAIVSVSEYLTRHHRRRRRTVIIDHPGGERAKGDRRVYR